MASWIWSSNLLCLGGIVQRTYHSTSFSLLNYHTTPQFPYLLFYPSLWLLCRSLSADLLQDRPMNGPICSIFAESDLVHSFVFNPNRSQNQHPIVTVHLRSAEDLLCRESYSLSSMLLACFVHLGDRFAYAHVILRKNMDQYS